MKIVNANTLAAKFIHKSLAFIQPPLLNRFIACKQRGLCSRCLILKAAELCCASHFGEGPIQESKDKQNSLIRMREHLTTNISTPSFAPFYGGADTTSIVIVSK